jgi:hypothetical protein
MDLLAHSLAFALSSSMRGSVLAPPAKMTASASGRLITAQIGGQFPWLGQILRKAQAKFLCEHFRTASITGLRQLGSFDSNLLDFILDKNGARFRSVKILR